MEFSKAEKKKKVQICMINLDVSIQLCLFKTIWQNSLIEISFFSAFCQKIVKKYNTENYLSENAEITVSLYFFRLRYFQSTG